MIPYPDIDPDLLTLGPLRIRWYGMMYILGLVATYFLVRKQEASRKLGLTGPVVQDLVFYVAVGLIVGARLGYVLFYQYHDYGYYWKHPLEIVATWHGGMSFHGGMAGGLLAGWWLCRRRGLPFLAVADSVAVTAPVGLGLGRVGNFINGELFGRATDVPWAMIFPQGGDVPRHPSQLYEAFLEGAVLFAILWTLRRRPRPDGMMVAFFLFFYGLFRFAVEFFREPDAQLGLVAGPFSMGQVLCFLMMAAGAALALYARRGASARGPLSSEAKG